MDVVQGGALQGGRTVTKDHVTLGCVLGLFTKRFCFVLFVSPHQEPFY